MTADSTRYLRGNWMKSHRLYNYWVEQSYESIQHSRPRTLTSFWINGLKLNYPTDSSSIQWWIVRARVEAPNLVLKVQLVTLLNVKLTLTANFTKLMNLIGIERYWLRSLMQSMFSPAACIALDPKLLWPSIQAWIASAWARELVKSSPWQRPKRN